MRVFTPTGGKRVFDNYVATEYLIISKGDSMLYPRVFRYSDRMSIDKDAIIDLKISYDAKVIARSNGAEVGDMAIVVARNNNSDYCSLFICEIKKEVGETSLWKRKGGKKWKRGFIVQPLSKIVSLHKVMIESIMDRNITWRLFDGYSFSSPLIRKNAHAMQKLIDYCIKHHPA